MTVLTVAKLLLNLVAWNDLCTRKMSNAFINNSVLIRASI